MVTRKKRGSGLLPYPKVILDTLEKIIEKLPIKISIKTRLGYSEPSELLNLLPELDHFPLSEIIIHARLGKQLYRGTTDLASFAACLLKTSHTITYNGDINDLDIFHDLQKNFPQINRWMLGRGAIGNPFLAEEIKGIASGSAAEKKERLQIFHAALFKQSESLQSGPGHLLGKLKQFWTYFGAAFPDRHKMFKKIMKSHTPEQYLESVAEIFTGP
jgi:tRNA-dihydrouridine synthase